MEGDRGWECMGGESGGGTESGIPKVAGSRRNRGI